MIRSDIIRIRELEYVQAARAAGAGNLRILLRHILPNAIWPVVVQASMSMGSIVITAAALSFLGARTNMGYADWGQLISFGRSYLIGLGGDPLV